jgi:hypothetical protein
VEGGNKTSGMSKNVGLTMEGPEKAHYTRYYEHDGMLRAYATAR